MSRNHKHRSESIMGNLSPHLKLREKRNIRKEKPLGVHPRNIASKQQGFNEVNRFANHEDTSLVAPRKIRVLLIITVLGTGGATNVVLDIAGHFNNHSDFDIEILTGPIVAVHLR